MSDVLTLWVRLKGDERDRAEYMRTEECRTYASLLRAALKLYYETNYVPDVPAEVVAL